MHPTKALPFPGDSLLFTFEVPPQTDLKVLCTPQKPLLRFKDSLLFTCEVPPQTEFKVPCTPQKHCIFFGIPCFSRWRCHLKPISNIFTRSSNNCCCSKLSTSILRCDQNRDPKCSEPRTLTSDHGVMQLVVSVKAPDRSLVYSSTHALSIDTRGAAAHPLNTWPLSNSTCRLQPAGALQGVWAWMHRGHAHHTRH